MFDYAIGDIQGCYEPLMRLLDHIHFNDRSDRLWFVGDLVNRGPQSLQVLRFIKNLPRAPYITLGNHDLHLLGKLFGGHRLKNRDDTLQEILLAPDAEELGHWLRKQAILHYDEQLNVVMCHAGIAPVWSLTQARDYAQELEQALRGEDYGNFFTHMYGNEPDYWSEELTGMDRLRVITNYFTRMRFCDQTGRLIMAFKGKIDDAPRTLIPWFAVPHRVAIPADIVFGHWAALEGQCSDPHAFAIDTGCLWGSHLTALRLQDRQRFAVPGLSHKM